MARRSDVLELAILGLLHEGSKHGYELRKQLNSMLGTFHAISYGSLYPTLKSMLAKGGSPKTDRPTPAPRHCPAGGRGSSTNSPQRARSTSRRCWTIPVRRRGRTSASTSI